MEYASTWDHTQVFESKTLQTDPADVFLKEMGRTVSKTVFTREFRIAHKMMTCCIKMRNLGRKSGRLKKISERDLHLVGVEVYCVFVQ